MFVALVSEKAPGTTMLSLALAAAATRTEGQVLSPLVVEMDPAGGDVAGWFDLSVQSGMVSLAAALHTNRDGSSGDLETHSQPLPAGGRVVVLPPAGEALAPAIDAVCVQFGSILGAADRLIIGDAGRWTDTQPTRDRLSAAAAVGVLVSPTVAGIDRARHLVSALRAHGVAEVGVVPVGDRPYRPDQIAEVVGAALWGAITWDPGTAADLMAGHSGRGLKRSLLIRAADMLLSSITRTVGAPSPMHAVPVTAESAP